MSDHYDIGDLPATSRIDLDGLSGDQARVLRALIHRVIRRKCVCEHLNNSILCGRCIQVRDIREHFPQNWQRAADIAAQVGPLG